MLEGNSERGLEGEGGQVKPDLGEWWHPGEEQPDKKKTSEVQLIGVLWPDPA